LPKKQRGDLGAVSFRLTIHHSVDGADARANWSNLPEVRTIKKAIWKGPTMPAYEYECAACSHHFERRQKMSELPVSVCPDCGGSVKRLISGGAGAITKGSGRSLPAEKMGCGLGGGCGAESGGGCCGNMACEN
jgi:putative FmdB family regulatory protein